MHGLLCKQMVREFNRLQFCNVCQSVLMRLGLVSFEVDGNAHCCCVDAAADDVAM